MNFDGIQMQNTHEHSFQIVVSKKKKFDSKLNIIKQTRGIAAITGILTNFAICFDIARCPQLQIPSILNAEKS